MVSMGVTVSCNVLNCLNIYNVRCNSNSILVLDPRREFECKEAWRIEPLWCIGMIGALPLVAS